MSDQVMLSVYTEEIRTLIRDECDDQAIALCRHILRYYPKHVQTYGQMAEALLQKEDLENAEELFRRVLCADPENIVAFAGLAMIFEKQYLNEEAIWHLERAFELAPSNPEIRKELLHLYGEAGGGPQKRLKPTPGTLARLYLEQGLYPQAIQELEELVAASPKRLDLGVALAVALWQAGRVHESAELAQKLLAELPFCLKANLIVGTTLHDSAPEESISFLETAQALDPSNQIAQELLGSRSPLALVSVSIPKYVEGEETATPTEALFEQFPSAEWSVPEDATAPEPDSVKPALESSSDQETAAPAFVQAMGQASAEPVDSETPTPEPAPEATAVTAEAVPDRTEATEPEAPDAGPAPTSAESPLPPWLRADFRAQTQIPQSPAEPIPMPTIVSSELPLWLTELQNTMTETLTAQALNPIEPPAHVSESPGAPGPTEPIESSEGPAETGAEPPVPAETTRVEGIDLATSETILPPASSEPLETKDEDWTPDWLKPRETTAAETEPTAESLVKPEESEIATDEMPDWLQELRARVQAHIESDTSEAMATGEASPSEETVPPDLVAETKLVAEEAAQSVVEEQAASEAPAPPTPAEPQPPAQVAESAQSAIDSASKDVQGSSPAPGSAVPDATNEQPRRPKTRLERARRWVEANDLTRALEEYEYVIQHMPILVDLVISDLEKLTQRPDAPVAAHQTLGEAYTRADRQAEALEQYRLGTDRSS